MLESKPELDHDSELETGSEDVVDAESEAVAVPVLNKLLDRLIVTSECGVLVSVLELRSGAELVALLPVL